MTSGYRSQQGYLVLADISGYTAFLTGTEIEHAQGIIQELTTLIRERLTPPMRFVKLEGDAVFCYAPDAAFPDGERLLELIEVCYVDFSNRLLNMARAATCHCTACASIDTLGLKFVAHHGGYVIERDGDREDLAGADVILLHRLLKNGIARRCERDPHAVVGRDVTHVQFQRPVPPRLRRRVGLASSHAASPARCSQVYGSTVGLPTS